METVVRLVTSLQSVLQLLAVGAALFALYELLRDPDWRVHPGQTLARVWIVSVCGVVGVVGLLFGQNAVLLLADRLEAPLRLVQAGFLVTLVAAVVGWSRS
jgi:hypothetical protein